MNLNKGYTARLVLVSDWRIYWMLRNVLGNGLGDCT